jgi:hypothetical protein
VLRQKGRYRVGFQSVADNRNLKLFSQLNELWYVGIEVRELTVLRDGQRAPRGTSSRNLYYPCCFRDSSEIRPRPPSSGSASATRRGASR